MGETETIGANRPPDLPTLYWIAGHLYADATKAQAVRELMASGSDRLRVDAHANALLGAVSTLVAIAKDVESGAWKAKMEEVERAQEEKDASATAPVDSDPAKPGDPA